MKPAGKTMVGSVFAVTGAAAGIGAAACRALAATGATVYALDVRHDLLQALSESVDARNGRVVAIGCDVTRPDSIEAAFDQIGSASKRVDALLCSAGVFPRIGLAEMEPAHVSQVIDVNFRGSVHCVLRAVRSMPEGGRVVLMTSGGGSLDVARHRFQRGFSLYGASKAALDRWAFGVADELAERGITINVLCPGAVVRTPGVERLGLSGREMETAVSASDVAPAAVALLTADTGGATANWLRATEFGRTWGGPAGWTGLHRSQVP